jgi:hypothetical protein
MGTSIRQTATFTRVLMLISLSSPPRCSISFAPGSAS